MVRRLKIPHRHAREHMPSEEEFGRMLDVAQEQKRPKRDRMILLVLGEGGFRATEFVSIKDYWLIDGGVNIPISDPKARFKAKTSKAARRVLLRKMSRYAWDLLSDYTKAHGGIDFSYDTVYLRVKQLGEMAELRRELFPHALRAYCAQRWAFRVQNPYTLMRMMGWATPGIAMAYVEATGVEVEKAIDHWHMKEAGIL